MTRSKAAARVLLVAIALFGASFAWLGLAVLRPGVTAPAGWTTVEGRVVGVAERPGENGMVYAPVVAYTDAAGGVHEATGWMWTPSVPAAGAMVEVAYDPADPGDGFVKDDSGNLIWILFTGVGLLFVLVPVLILAFGMGGRSGRTPLGGDAVTDPATGRTVFSRSRVYVILMLILPWGGVLAMSALAWFVFQAGGIAAVMSILAGFFAVYLFVGGLAALRRGLDGRVIEVGPDGVWLPELGERRWDEFSDIRLESFTGPGAGGGDDGGSGVARYRRLGFVPMDPTLAARRGAVERAGWGMGTGFYRFTMALMRGRPIEHAPFGVDETGLGSETFSRLVELVDTYRFLGAAAGAPPPPLDERVLADDIPGSVAAGPAISDEGGGATVTAAGAAVSPAPGRWGRLARLGQSGFGVGLLLAILLRIFAGPSGPPIEWLIWLAVVSAGAMALWLARAARAARAEGQPALQPVVALVAGAALGLIVPSVILGGLGVSWPGPTSTPPIVAIPGLTAPPRPAPPTGPAEHIAAPSLGAPQGEYQVVEINGRVPAGARRAVVGFRTNNEGAGPGWADLTFYEVGLSLDGGPNLVPEARFGGPTWPVPGWETGQGVLVASDRGPGMMLRAAASPTQTLGYNTLEIPVTPGGAYRAWFAVRLPESSNDSSDVMVVFLGLSGEDSRRVLPLRAAG